MTTKISKMAQIQPSAQQKFGAFGSFARRFALKPKRQQQHLAMALDCLARKDFPLASKHLDELSNSLAFEDGDTLLHKLASAFDPNDPSVAEFACGRASKLKHLANAPNRYHQSPLHSAAAARNAKFAETLLALGADPNLLDQDERTPLMLLLQQTAADSPPQNTPCELATLQTLLWSGADPNLADAAGARALHSALLASRPDLAKTLLMHGARIGDALQGTNLLEFVASHEKARPCLAAVLSQHERADQEILAHAVWTAAAKANDTKMLAELEAFARYCGAEPSYGSDALFASIANGNPELAGRIASLPRLPPMAHATSSPDGFPVGPLHYAAFLRQPECAKALLAAGGDPGAALAATGAQIQKSIRESRGPTADSPFSYCSPGMTPLMASCLAGCEATAAVLLDAGCPIAAIDDDGKSALDYAAFFDSEPCARLLLERCGDARAELAGWAKDSFGAMDTAIKHNAWRCAALFLRHGFDPERRNAMGETAFIKAALHDHPSLISALAGGGSNIFARDHFGKSALDRALQFSNLAAAGAIRDAMSGPPPAASHTRSGSTNLFDDDIDDGPEDEEDGFGEKKNRKTIAGALLPLRPEEWDAKLRSREDALRDECARRLALAFGPAGIDFLAMAGLGKVRSMKLAEAAEFAGSLGAQTRPCPYPSLSLDQLRAACEGLDILEEHLGFAGPAISAAPKKRRPCG